MWEFIVSGYIPGTDFQMSFTMLMNLYGLLFVGFLFVQLALSTDYDVSSYTGKIGKQTRSIRNLKAVDFEIALLKIRLTALQLFSR